MAAISVIAAASADIIVLTRIDWDYEAHGLLLVLNHLRAAGVVYPYWYFPKPVSGQYSGLDLDGDGRLAEAEDAMGYGRFTGDNGVALLSRYPIEGVTLHHEARFDLMPQIPLASTSFFTSEIRGLTLISLEAQTPVFDGAEDRNGRRNAQQLRLVAGLAKHVSNPLVVGRLNVDLHTGEGRREPLMQLLAHPRLQDTLPQSASGKTQTALWERAGAMRLDYVLPPRSARIVGSGVLWGEQGLLPAERVEKAGAGRLVWLDLAMP